MPLAFSPPADSRTGSRRQAPQALPCCLRQVAQWAYYGMLRDNDPFDETVRKGGACVGVAIGALVPVAVASELSNTGASTPAAAAFIATAALGSIGWFATYGLVRADLVPSRVAMSVMVAANLVTLVFAALASSTFPVYAACLHTVIAAAMLNLPRRWLWFIFCLPPYVLSAYNHCVRALEYDYPPLLLEGASAPRGLHARLTHYLVLYVFTVLFAWVFYLMHDEYARRIERSRASAALASLVADRLAQYDTEAAQWLLHAASGPPVSVTGAAVSDPTSHSSATAAGVVDTVRGADSKLVSSLETIVANLESYRPHLPNWMVDAALAERSPTAAPQQGEAAARSRAYGAVDSTSTADIDTASTFSRSGRSGDDDDESNHRRRQRHRDRSGSAHREDVLPGLVGSGSDRAASKLASSLHAPNEATRKVRVARARVHYAVQPLGRAAGVDRRRSRAIATTSFVDAVHAAARHTKAAVHSFIGDTVEVSWNAASGVTAPGLKAARFLARLQSAVADLNSSAAAANDSAPVALAPPGIVRVRAGAIACKGTIQTAGSGLQKAITLSIGARDTKVLTALANGVADDADSMLVSASVASDAFGVDLCPIATYAPRSGGKATERAFLVVGEAPVDDTDDWLFVLSQAGGGDAGARARPDELLCTAVREAFDAAVDQGDVAAASEMLATVVRRFDERPELPPHVRVPIQRLADALAAMAAAAVSDPARETKTTANDNVLAFLQL